MTGLYYGLAPEGGSSMEPLQNILINVNIPTRPMQQRPDSSSQAGLGSVVLGSVRDSSSPGSADLGPAHFGLRVLTKRLLLFYLWSSGSG